MEGWMSGCMQKSTEMMDGWFVGLLLAGWMDARVPVAAAAGCVCRCV